MSNNPRHIVQRYYVAPQPSSASGAWNMREQQQSVYDGTWLPSGIIPIVNYAAIGGGGGGGGATSGSTVSRGGGGGAGGLVTGTVGPTYKQAGGFLGYTLTITVGASGAGGGVGSQGNNGGDTTIAGQFFTLGTLYAYGGGGGGAGAQSPAYGNNGGSGGGGGGWASGYGSDSYVSLATQPTSTYGGYGFRGGVGGYGLVGGGGGGAGGQGVDNRIYNSSTGQWGIANGGASSVVGGPGRYVNVAASSSYAGIFGIGGSQVGSSINGYGSGGGAGVTQGTGGSSGNNGVVIFWYNSSFSAPSVITGSYTYSLQNGFRIYVFDYPGGTITF